MDQLSSSTWLDRTEGFSLVELLVAMAVGIVVLGAMYSVFTIQNKTFTDQEELVVMQQNVRAAMDVMVREIGMAGYDPTRVNSDDDSSNDFYGVTVNSSQLQIKADLGGSGIDSSSQENIIYKFFGSPDYKITRNIGVGNQTLAENIESFTFKYLKSSDPTDTSTDHSSDVEATRSPDVRQIRITITGRTAKPSTTNGTRTYTLTSVVTPRNLAY